MLEIINLNKANKIVQSVDIVHVQDLLQDSNNLLWFDFHYPQNVEPDAEIIYLLENILKIQPPNITKCIIEQRLPSYYEYEDYIMVIIFAIELEEDNEIKFIDLALFLGKNFVITYRHEKINEIEHMKKAAKIRAAGHIESAVGLFHMIATHIVDNYMIIIDNFGIDLDKIEESLFKENQYLDLETINKFREKINDIRRIAVIENQIFKTLRREYQFKVTEAERYFFIDLYEHLEKSIAALDALKEEISGILQIQASLNAEKLNEIIKFLTMISTILLPASVIAVIIAPSLPKLHPFEAIYGFYLLIGLIFLIAVCMTLFFKKKGWL